MPSPTTVYGLPSSFWARKTPKTAPYVPEVLDRGPYALIEIHDVAGVALGNRIVLPGEEHRVVLDQERRAVFVVFLSREL